MLIPSKIQVVCEKAAGFFVHALMAVEFVTSKSDGPTGRLPLIAPLPTKYRRKSTFAVILAWILGKSSVLICTAEGILKAKECRKAWLSYSMSYLFTIIRVFA